MIIFLLFIIVLILLFGASAIIGAVGYILGTLAAFVGLVWLLATYGPIGILYAVAGFLLALAALYGIGIIEGKMRLKKLYREKGWGSPSTPHTRQGYILIDQASGKPVDINGTIVNSMQAHVYSDWTTANTRMMVLEARGEHRYMTKQI